MQITIDHLSLTSFKGIKSLSLDLYGKSADIRGRNGTGKTTLFDAFTWLLFGKDSKDSANFDYKPLDENGQPRTGSDTEVEAVLNVDGIRQVKLRRVRHEKWVQRPGNSNPVYQGDETLCWIDDVPVALEKDYQPYISKLIGDVEQFKTLSIHGYFMRKHWKDRRKMLVDAAGGGAEAEIMARPEFAEVEDILAGKTVEDAKKRLADQRKRIASELDMIPARLDELQRSLEPVTDKDVMEADLKIEELKKEIRVIDDQLAGTMESFARAQSMATKVNDLNALIDVRRMMLDKPNREHLNELKLRLSEADCKYASLDREIWSLVGDLQLIDRDIATLQQQREQLLTRWEQREGEVFVSNTVDTVCSLCGQPLPPEKIANAKQMAYMHWAEEKENDLKLIETQGKTTADRITRLQTERANVAASLARKQAAIDETAKEREAIAEELNRPVQAPDYDSDPEIIAHKAEIEKIQKEMTSGDPSAVRNDLYVRRNALAVEIGTLGNVRFKMEARNRTLERISELEDRRQVLGQDAIRIDGEIALLGDFVHACCDAMEEQINAMFSTIRWHLTDYRKDGTPVDCCVPYVGGVSYDSTLNNGAMINAGIEAIRVLSRAAAISVPCFVDNAEAVNQLAYLPGQMIKLSVSNDPELTMTLEE